MPLPLHVTIYNAGAPILLLHAAFRRHPMSAELGESATTGSSVTTPGITAFVGAMSIVAANSVGRAQRERTANARAMRPRRMLR